LSPRDTGTILDGKYEILERLATGGMGEVYKARHMHLQEVRVIKVLRPDRAADPQAAQRFLQEARTATQIKHPNVAILYDYSRLADGRFYMVWEYIEGEDVGNWLRRTGPFPLPLAVELGIQALRGLEAIHAAGVIHRDISPDNLMVRKDAKGRHQLKIIDLGLAKDLSTPASLEITQAGVFMGKLRYCAPEQAGQLPEGKLDHRADLYSFAAVLYEMVSGMAPFDSENHHGFVLRRLTEPPLPLAGRNPAVQVPRELDAVVLRGLERDREKRYPDAVAFITALVRVADALRGADTQEMQVQARAAARPVSPAAPAVGQPAAIPRLQSRELSREEKLDLLAQIDRAAKKVNEVSQVVEQAEQAFAAGRLDEAKQLAEQAQAGGPRQPRLERLVARLRETEEAKERDAHVGEAEQMVEQYLQGGKHALAAFALESLFDLRPDHPRRAEYERRLGAMADSTERKKKVEEAAAGVREALIGGDLRTARMRLDAAERDSPGAADLEAIRAELAEGEAELRRADELEQHRRRFDGLLAGGRIAEAEKEFEAISRLETSRLTLDLTLGRLEEGRERAQLVGRSQEFERRFRERLAARDWAAARGVVHEYEASPAAGDRPSQMLGELAKEEDGWRRKQAFEQGVKQVETFIAQSRPLEAETALKILGSLDAQNPELKRLDRQIKALWKG
jgi:serine/threonine-protein kinase